MDKIRAQKLFPCRKPSSHYVTVIFPTDARWRELGEKIYISALIFFIPIIEADRSA